MSYRPSVKFVPTRGRPVFVILQKKGRSWRPIPELEFDREKDRNDRLKELRKLETFEV